MLTGEYHRAAIIRQRNTSGYTICGQSVIQTGLYVIQCDINGLTRTYIIVGHTERDVEIRHR